MKTKNKAFINSPLLAKVGAGFTLIELLVVVAIVALLAILAISILTRQIGKGNDARRKADLNRIGVAAEEYEKDHNCYPTAISCGEDPNQQIYPYLRNVPCDPVTKLSYSYEHEPGMCPSWYRIYATLQYTADSAIISGIGPAGAYNYYQRSPNAPVIEPGATSNPASGTNTGSNLYACQGGHLVLITWDPSICAQTFSSSAFESYCGTPENPQNDCYPP